MTGRCGPRIEDVEVFPAAGAMYVRVTTDVGVHGVGESTYFAWPDAPAAVARAFRSTLAGRSPFETETLGLELYRWISFRGMAVSGAIAAIDQALWDIKGKLLDVPVWQLLGGRVRPAVRAMLVLQYGTLEEVAAEAGRAAAAGYSAIKVLLFQDEHHGMTHAARVRDMVARLTAIRETVGWDVDVAVEIHRNMGPNDSLALIRELAPLRPVFVEDPVPPDSVTVFRDVAARSVVPMAAGERNTTIWEFAEYAACPGVEFLRPDVGIAGGITHVRKIAALAEARHLLLAPHAVPSGAVATAAHVQLGMCTPSWWAQEHRVQSGTVHEGHVDAIVPVVDGDLVPPDRPGLGIDLDVTALTAPVPPAAPVAVPRRIDGSVGYR